MIDQTSAPCAYVVCRRQAAQPDRRWVVGHAQDISLRKAPCRTLIDAAQLCVLYVGDKRLSQLGDKLMDNLAVFVEDVQALHPLKCNTNVCCTQVTSGSASLEIS